MKLVIVGVNHELLNLDQRECFHFRESDKFALGTLLKGENVHQNVILSTCNRSEVYCLVDEDFDETIIKNLYLSFFKQEDSPIYLKVGYEALLYLLEVACGLKSMVVGEDQILHQIKNGHAWAMENHFSKKEMNYIFQSVIGFSKRMKSQYAISNHPLSLSYIGYQSIKDVLKPGDKVMICGIGEMAKLMVEYLKDYPMILVNRTYENVLPYLNENRQYVPFDDRYQYVNDVRVVISATSGPHIIYRDECIDCNHELTFLDLAMPRDIDLKLSSRYEVIDMDKLNILSKKHLEKRKEIALQIHDECLNYVVTLDEGLKMMKSDRLIQTLQQRYLSKSDETFEFLKRKLTLSQKEEYILKKVLKTSYLSLLKDPIKILKSQDLEMQEKYIELFEEMYGGYDE